MIRRAPIGARLSGAPIAAVTPWAMPISTGSGPEGSTAKPRDRMRSSIVPPLPSTHSVGPRIGKGEALENLLALDAVHDELQAVAPVVIEPVIEPDGRIERVLRALHEGHSV